MLRVSLLLALALASTIVRAATTAADELATMYPPRGYVFDEDCFLHALQFEHDFTREHPAERARHVILRIPGDRNHSAAAFTFASRLYLWDQVFGVMPLALPAKQFDHEGAVRRRAELLYRERVRRTARAALPGPSARLPRERAGQIRYMRAVQQAFPAYASARLHSVLTPHGEKFFLVRSSARLFTAYSPGLGTAMLPLRQEMSAKERAGYEPQWLSLCAERIFGVTPVITLVPPLAGGDEPLTAS